MFQLVVAGLGSLCSDLVVAGLGSLSERGQFWDIFEKLSGAMGKAGQGAVIEGIHAEGPCIADLGALPTGEHTTMAQVCTPSTRCQPCTLFYPAVVRHVRGVNPCL